MNPFIHQMINYKINQLTVDELLALSAQYQFSLSRRDAQKIIKILRSETIDIANTQQRDRLIARIKKEVSPKTAQEINKLMDQFADYL